MLFVILKHPRDRALLARIRRNPRWGLVRLPERVLFVIVRCEMTLVSNRCSSVSHSWELGWNEGTRCGAHKEVDESIKPV